MSGTRRIRYIDLLKALAMMLVIAGHINFANGPLKPWIYAFHMPAFFFASGLVSREEGAGSAGAFAHLVWKRAQSLLLPYILWALIYAELTLGNLARIVWGSYATICSSGALSSLWFLPALFLATLLYDTVITLTKGRLWVKALLAAVCLAAALTLPRLPHGYPWCLDVSLMAAV